MRGLAGLFPWFRAVRTRTTRQELNNLHVCNIRVLLIVVSDRQEISIHRFNVSTTGFGEHILQCREPLCVPLEGEKLCTTIQRTGLGSETGQSWSKESADLSFIPQQGTEVSCLISWGCRRIDEVSISMRLVDVLC